MIYVILKVIIHQKAAFILADNNFNFIISSWSNKIHIGIEYNLEIDKEYYLFADSIYKMILKIKVKIMDTE